VGDGPRDSPDLLVVGSPLVVDHPLVSDRLATLRDLRSDGATFRRVLGEISAAIAYEALRDLGTEDRLVDTPVSRRVRARVVSETILLVPVLRAGLGMVPAIQQLVGPSDVAHVGIRRDEVSLSPGLYLDKLPSDLSGRRVVICDPMLATGGSLSAVAELVAARGATMVQALCVIASAPGVEAFRRAHPRVRLSCAAIDPDLDERGFIVPGLGDAGDRLFGPPY